MRIPMSSSKPSDDLPISLTVHSMPQYQDAQAASAGQTRVGRWKMLLVLLACAAPVVASYFTYYVVRPEGRRNFGELITPQRDLPDLVATAMDGTPQNLRALKGQWLLISVGSGACNATCERHLYLQRQLREGLGKEKDRVDWVWLINDDVAVPPALTPALKGATVLRVPTQGLARWLEPQVGANLERHLYLVDPIGNWMMRFPVDVDATNISKVKKDLERVLKASAFWDNAGR
jgi:hypothetical protein